MTEFSSNQPVKSTLTAGQSLVKWALSIVIVYKHLEKLFYFSSCVLLVCLLTVALESLVSVLCTVGIQCLCCDVIDVSVLKLCELMPHQRPVRFRQDQQLQLSDVTQMSVTPFIYSPLHLSPAKNNTCPDNGCTVCHIDAIHLFMLYKIFYS